MKKLLKFLSLTLTLILTFSFIGCNKTTPTEEPENLSVQLTSSETVIDREKGTVTKTLTATVYPENATNKKVDWYIDWTEELAEPLNVENFVTVTPLEDGSNVAKVTCYRWFENDIKITAVTRAGNFSAVCYVEYDGAPENFKIRIDNTTYTTESPLIHVYSGDTYTVDLELYNVFGKVGSRYSKFRVSDFGGSGIVNVLREKYEPLWADDGALIGRGELIDTQEQEINLSDKTNLANIKYWYSINIFESLFFWKINKNNLEIKFKGNESYIDVWDGEGINHIVYIETIEPCTFYITVEENITGMTFRFNFDIENRVTSVSLDNSTLYF